jgi:hypothetical protein
MGRILESQFEPFMENLVARLLTINLDTVLDIPERLFLVD